MTINTLICNFFSHRWSPMDHRPCERFRTCFRCGEEDVTKGWHRFSNWSAIIKVNVLEDHHGKAVQVNQNRQNRTCSDCNWIDERVILQ